MAAKSGWRIMVKKDRTIVNWIDFSLIKGKQLKSILNILTFITMLMSSVTFGQTTNKCDTIYECVDKMPQYDKDINGLMDYLNVQLVPIISDCMKRDSDLIASLHIVLTIDKNGKVIDASFSRPNLTDQCKSDLKKNLLTMKGWTAGQLNGKSVCTHFHWPISCLQWE